MTASGRSRPTFVSIAYTHAPGDPRVRRECESLVRAGWRVIQIGLGAPGEGRVGHLAGMLLLRVPERRYRGDNVVRYAWSYLRFFFQARALLQRVIERYGADAVQVTNLPNSLVWAAWPARRAGGGIILDIRDPVPEFFACKFGDRAYGPAGVWLAEIEERLAAMGADLVVTANEPHRRLTATHGVREKKLRLVLNSADERLFPLLPPRVSNGRLAYAGTVAERMGLDVILAAVALLRRQGEGVQLDILGDGDAVPLLQAERDRLGLAEAVSVTGQRFRIEDLPAKLANVGIGIVPLRRDSFTDLLLSMKLLEYVRLGIPAIVTRTPTLSHYFPADAVTFVDEHTPEAWARAIRGVLDDPEGARQRAERAQRVPAADSWQAIEGDFVRLIEEAAAIRSGSLRGTAAPITFSQPLRIQS
ncbi:MAG TPA: glycosyltransferase [Gemmatimonadales bacterium]